MKCCFASIALVITRVPEDAFLGGRAARLRETADDASVFAPQPRITCGTRQVGFRRFLRGLTSPPTLPHAPCRPNLGLTMKTPTAEVAILVVTRAVVKRRFRLPVLAGAGALSTWLAPGIRSGPWHHCGQNASTDMRNRACLATRTAFGCGASLRSCRFRQSADSAALSMCAGLTSRRDVVAKRNPDFTSNGFVLATCFRATPVLNLREYPGLRCFSQPAFS